MSEQNQVLVTRAYLEDTGDALREQLETEATYTPSQFGDAIRSIPNGADAVKYTVQELTTAQQAQARANISAAQDAPFVGGENTPTPFTGAVITAEDSAAGNIPAFTLYGKSTQSGTPSPASPVPIVTAGSGGSVGIVIADDAQGTGAVTTTLPTPNGLPGIPVSSGGNYTDTDGQMWICDTIDKAAGTYTQRVKRLALDGTENWTAWNGVQHDGFQTFRIYEDNAAIGRDGNYMATDAQTPVIMCSSLEPGSISSAVTSAGTTHACVAASNTSSGLYFVVPNSIAGTAEQMKAWVAQTPMTVLYPLATPVTTSLTAAQIAALDALRSRDGATVIYTTDATEPEMAVSIRIGTSGTDGLVPAPNNSGKYLCSDGTWKVPDTTPTANSEALITSGAVAAALAALEARVAALENS